LKTPKKRKSRGDGGKSRVSAKGEGLLGIKRQFSDLEGANLDESEVKPGQYKVSFQLGGEKKEDF